MGPEVTFRGEPHGTFKLLFNGLFYGAAKAVTIRPSPSSASPTPRRSASKCRSPLQRGKASRTRRYGGRCARFPEANVGRR